MKNIAIIGAGMAGIAAARTLIKRLGTEYMTTIYGMLIVVPKDLLICH